MTEAKLKAGERVNQLFSTDIKIIQNSEVFSYSVDSVLLSRFPKLPKRGLIVDLCAGNGAVGLFASTRTQAQILAVEIQERLADMAQRSIELNDLAQQMQVIHDDLKNLGNHISGSKVDIILCNPPYFKVDEHSNLNGSEHYLLARHEVATNLEEICTIAQRVLKSNGRLAMVHRPDRFLDILETMKNHNLAPKRIQFVYPKQGREANMLLIEAIKDGSPDGLKCGDGTLYTGYTTDVDARLKTHQAGKGAKYTRARLPVTLIYQEEHPDKSAAMSAEALFKKKKRAEKLAYIEEKRSKSLKLLRFLISTFKIK